MRYFILLFALIALPVNAEFTSAQKTTILADIQANPDLKSYWDIGAMVELSILYNTPTTFIVWRTAVTTNEIMEGDFVWSTVDNLTTGKARIWEWMTMQGSINPSKLNVRQGMANAFGAGSAMANAILPILKRQATRIEKLLATGTGTDADPGLLVFEGSITPADLSRLQ